jgi:hypothetical protein
MCQKIDVMDENFLDEQLNMALVIFYLYLMLYACVARFDLM